MRRVLAGIRGELETRTTALNTAVRTRLLRKASVLEQLSGKLQALSPVAILERGYAVVFDSSGKILKDSTQVQVGDEITARLARGEVTATVKKKV